MNLNYNDGQAGIGQTERQALDMLSRLGKPTIRAHDLETTLGYSREISNLMLSRLCKKGWVQRLKSGIYRIVPLGSESANPVPEDAWAIAMELLVVHQICCSYISTKFKTIDKKTYYSIMHQR